MKKHLTRRILALVLSLAMVLSLLPSAFAAELPFTDVKEGAWYAKSVAYVLEKGLMKGTTDTTFGPNETMTRAMLVTVLYRAENQPKAEAPTQFTDVPAKSYYTKAVGWAVEHKITKGTSATTFSPNAELTREMLATFVYRYAEAMGYDTAPRASLDRFPDKDDASKYAKTPLQWAVALGILKGDDTGTLRPKDPATRAEAAAMLMRALESMKPLEDQEDLTGKTVILHTNDTHGALLGFAQVAKVKADFEAKGAQVLLVDAGDFSQGTTYVSSNKGQAAVTMLNAAGYDLVTLGNHEFDFGYATLVSNMEKAQFQPITADVLLKETGKSIFDGHVIKEIQGLKLGFFGMETPETFTKVNPGLIQEITFPQGEAMYACAQAEVDALKAEGAELIIGLVHLGVDPESEPNRSTDLYAQVSGIDFLIDGHSHTVMTEGPNGEPIQSTGTKASKTALMNVGMIQIDNATKTIEKHELIPLGEDAPVDEAVAAVAQEIMDAVDAEYGAVFARSEVELNGDRAPGNRTEETNLGDLIADALRWSVAKDATLESLSEVPQSNIIAITNGGGIRAWIHKGDVTKNDVNTVLPFGNTVSVAFVTGAELLEALEASTYCTPTALGGFPQVSGIQFNINTEEAYDKGEQYPDSTYFGPKSIRRVTIDNINGEPFSKAAIYAVVTNNFCAAGGDTYYALKNAKLAEWNFDTGLPMDEVLMDYITEELDGVIGTEYAEPQGRISFRGQLAATCFPSTDNADIAKYGNIYTSLEAEDFFDLGYTWGDVATVRFLDQELELPIVPTFSYVDQGTAGIFVSKDGETGEPIGRVFLAINMGNFAEAYGLAAKTTNADKSYFWTPMEGVEFPVPVSIALKEAGGYLDDMLLRDINRTNNREDYPALSDAEYANFRRIATTGMGDHLYRGSSPINPELNRNSYADAELEKAGVTVIMNLANSQAEAEAYEGYTDSYYSKQNIVFLNLGVDFQAPDFQAGLATGLRHFAQNEGSYYVHCTEGKDRAGFVSALLECFMGASYEEVVADYLKTYTNYYTVVDGQQQALSQETLEAIANSNIIKSLQTAFGVEDLKTADLAQEAQAYITEIGLSEAEIEALRANLGGSSPHRFQVDQTSSNSSRFGHVDIKISAAEFLELFDLGDLVEVELNGVSFEAPVVTNYDDVDTGCYLLRCANGKKVVTLAINYGQLGVASGLLEKFTDLETGDAGYRFVEGLEWPICATVTLKEAGGYADELSVRKLTRTNNRDDYADLSDAEFANFRAVTTTGMGSGRLYRSSSPIDPDLGRNSYADAAAQAAGIKTFINLADTQAEAQGFDGYADSYYSTQSVKFLGLPVAFTSDEFKTGLAEGYRFITQNQAPYLIHCLEGKDRTGLSVAVLECFMGASLEEVQADYLKTYENYFEVRDGAHVALTTEQEQVLKGIITKNLGIIFEAEDLSAADLKDEAKDYLLEIGLSEAEIGTLNERLG